MRTSAFAHSLEEKNKLPDEPVRARIIRATLMMIMVSYAFVLFAGLMMLGAVWFAGQWVRHLFTVGMVRLLVSRSS